MRDPHRLSAGLSPDPFYDAAQRTPSAPDSTLFGDHPEPLPGSSGDSSAPVSPVACWLYAPGDLEGFLMARMRHDAFAVCTGIFHPGAFHRPHGLVVFAHTLQLDALPEACPLMLWHSGELRVDVNGTLLLRSGQTDEPRAVQTNLRPLLRVGQNQLQFTVSRLDEPPCLLVRGATETPVLFTDATWTASTNLVDKSSAAAYPSAGTRWFPHQEALPVVRLNAPLSSAGIADFGCVLLGRPLLPEVDFAGLGESIAETRVPTAHAEQRPLFDDTRDRAFQFVATRGATLASGKIAADISIHPARYAGAFACSDERLTRIWHHAAASLRVSLRELTVDGLKRDRLPWAGDAYIATLGNAAVFGEHRCIARTLTALAPEDPAHRPTNSIIDYDAYWIIAVLAQWQFSGDDASARALWPHVEKILAALRAREDEHGFLNHKDTWLFIDWISFDQTARSVALQALYLGALDAAALLANFTGHGERAIELARKKDRLNAAILTVYGDDLTAGAQPIPASRHATFLANYFSVTDRHRLAATLAADTTGPKAATAYMRYFEAAALARGGDVAGMLASLRDYWGGMLDAGASTFWEGFDPAETGDARYAFYGRPFGKSLCHAWACGPLPLLSFELAGLRPLAGGWSNVFCSPRELPLAWACATIPTPHGPLRWEYETGELRIDAPPGVTIHPVNRGTLRGTTLVIPCG